MTLQRGTDVLETDRLVLRRIRPSDFEFFARIQADPVVALYIGPGRPRSQDESRAWLNATIRGYDSLGLGQLAVERKSDGLLVGRCGLSDLAIEVGAGSRTVPRCWWLRADVPGGTQVSSERELGWTFGREHWGNGYASEAARAVLAYAWDVLALPRIVSIIHSDNARSHKVAARLGAVKASPVELMGAIMDLYAWTGRAPA